MPHQRINGNLLCRNRDEYGELVVAEEGNMRSLYFGNGMLQSTIQIDQLDLLLEDYTEAMMAALLFGDPRTVLLIGLGGCSQVHFLLKALPDCAIDIVEIRQQVIDLSREFFFLPRSDKHLRIFHASGSDFMIDRAHPGSYDMILVDAFDESGPAAALLEKDFLSACRNRLNQGGVFVMNLWNSPGYDFPARYNTICEAFHGNVLKLLLAESYQNAIVFGFKDSETCRNLPDYRRGARDLQAKHGINFPRYLKQLYWQFVG